MSLASCSLTPAKSYSFYLVRHAEKATGPDPTLTQCGQLRATYLAEQLKNQGIQAVYSTDYRRTKQTAAPLASELQLTVNSYNPRKLADFAKLLNERQATALIVGHSNTTPKLAGILSKQKFDKLPESQFDQLFVVQVNGEQVAVEQQNQEFHCSKSKN